VSRVDAERMDVGILFQHLGPEQNRIKLLDARFTNKLIGPSLASLHKNPPKYIEIYC